MSISRRNFVKKSSIIVPAITIIPRFVLGGKGFISPSDKLNIACIGAGGKGTDDLKGVSSENIIAICDVDDARAKGAYATYPNAKKYKDYRRMLEEEKSIDGVTITTPDHTHAVITMAAMKKGLHVYTQKPITRTVDESRKIVDYARKNRIVTQMGNQGHANEGPRILNELIWQGAIGNIKEVHCWTNRPVWPQGIVKRPESTPPVPPTLDWDLWVGPSTFRPYHPDYVPFNWRAWWDFGVGALGDMGCHIMDYPFWALKLGAPISIEGYSSPVSQETAPQASMITYSFESGFDGTLFDLIWYDGGLKPSMPKGLENHTDLWDSIGGVIFKGDEGVLVYGHHRPKPVLLVNGKEKSYGTPKEMIPRSPGHYVEWINEIKGSKERAMSNFDYAGPLNEAVLLGNMAIRSGKKLLWDNNNMQVSNVSDANRFLKESYRSGWML